jgi:invasion protein IalB
MALSLDERVGALRFAALITTALMVFGLGGHAAAAEISDLTVSTSWKKFCVNSQKTGFNGICDTRAEARKRDDNALLAAVEVIEREGEPKKTLRVIFPLGIQLTPGTRLILAGLDPQQNPYVACTSAGCMSDYEATPALLGSMRAGQGLVVQAIDQSGRPLTVTLSLADFGVAYDGPGAEWVSDEIEAPRKPWLDDTLRLELRPPMR